MKLPSAAAHIHSLFTYVHVLRLEQLYRARNGSKHWTTARVCSDVPDAMLVMAHAASNCKSGLRWRGQEAKSQH